MPLKITKRINLSAIIVVIYILTVFAVSVLPFQSWSAAAAGLLASAVGSLVIFTLLKQWEAHLTRLKPAISPEAKPAPQNPFLSNANFLELENALAESQARHKELIEELNIKNEIMHKFETEKVQFEHRIGDVYHELNTFKVANEDELRRKTVLLSEYQETINQQRDVIKKKQDQILELESKVRDLNYEVKTLLQLAEIGNKSTTSGKNKEMTVSETVQAYQVDMFEDEEPSFQLQNLMIKTPEEAAVQLKRCIDIAQKITGANRFGNGNSRFKDMPIDNRALDLRRLFDNLRSEHAGTVIVYSQKDDKLLFANNQTTNLLGWSPDKFIKNFSEIIAEGTQEWKKGVGELSSNTLSKVRMVMKTKSGQNLLVHCHLGAIPTGAFRNHVIGVLYSS